MIALEEHNTNEREFYLVDNWCWLGSAGSADELQKLVQQPADPVLDKDSYRLLVKAVLGAKPLPMHQIRAPANIALQQADTNS